MAIGDVHGRDDWKEIVRRESDADKFIFVGDYFDTHENIGPAQQIINFNKIYDFKLEDVDRTVLLIGNHDFHYMAGAGESYSGFQPYYYVDINHYVTEALKAGLFQVAYLDKELKTLFTHAGVSSVWCMTNNVPVDDNIADTINKLFEGSLRPFRFYQMDGSGYGDAPEQGPLWIRPFFLQTVGLKEFKHVVGHTPHERVTCKDNIYFIDCINRSKYMEGEYLVIEDGKFQPKRLDTL